MPKPNVIAILCSDIHLSHKPPIARAAEESWYEAMARPLKQLRELAHKFDVQIICAGDIFNKYNPTPELINFAIENLPLMLAICGQHDIRHHDLLSIRESALCTLMKAKRIISLNYYNNYWFHDDVVLHGFPWGVELKPVELEPNIMQIAVVHSYCWMRNRSYPNAPKEQHVVHYQRKLKGFDLAVFGDNHNHFYHDVHKPNIYNCGCLIRRRFDEREYEPSVGLLYSNGHAERHKLDCSEDKWSDYTEIKVAAEAAIDMHQFISELDSLENDSFDFVEAVKRHCKWNKISKRVLKEILQAMEGK